MFTDYETSFRNNDQGRVTYSYVWATPTNKLTVLVMNFNGFLKPIQGGFYILDIQFNSEVNTFTLDKNRINGTLQQGNKLVGAYGNVLRKYNKDKKVISLVIRNLFSSPKKECPFSLQLVINDCGCWCNQTIEKIGQTCVCTNLATFADGFGSCGSAYINYCCAAPYCDNCTATKCDNTCSESNCILFDFEA